MPPAAVAAFTRNALSVSSLSIASAARGMALAPLTREVALVLVGSNKPAADAQTLLQIAPEVLSHGCAFLAITNAVGLFANRLTGSGLPFVSGTVSSGSNALFHPYIQILDGTTQINWDLIAKQACRWARERVASPTLQFRRPAKLGDEDALLLRRAFSEANQLHLTALTEGKSGASVFLVHARLNYGWASPLFVKLGPREEIIQEHKIYVENVDPYVPFHLGPGLAQDRCCLGATRGLLVGDFVDESESLLDCAKTGRSSAALSSLFHRALRGWHGREIRRSPQTLWKYLDDRKMLLQGIPRSRLRRATKLAGAPAPQPTTLNQRIKAASAKMGYRLGWIHSDLNARNVRVRSSDAILIDFKDSNSGPLILDAASLEASLFVSGGPGQHEKQGDFARWRRSVEPLYKKPLEMAPARAAPASRWSWFYDAVRQIRMHAREVEQAQGQYSVALGWALARKACKQETFRGPEADVRALAYVLAERVL